MSAALDAKESLAPGGDPLVGLPYRALQRLGAGGMGEVFLAQHRQLGRICVAKILHPRFAGDTRLADRVRLEAQTLGHLNHPHIVSIIGAGTTADDRPFIVMEHLRGQTLADEMLKRGHLPVLEALSFACQLLRALAAAHDCGIIHRDIKPENLFLCDNANGDGILKVLDFGIARVMPDAPPGAPQPLAVPTDTGMVVGTPRYVSPEGATARPVDHRADLYAAALVLYLMIAGRGPFDHIRSEALLLSAQAVEDPEPPSRFANAPIPPELDRVVLRALRKDPADRFQTADEMRQELERITALLQRSPGWLETSTFDPSSLAGTRRPLSQDEARRTVPQSDTAPLPEQASSRESAHVAVPRSSSFALEPRPSPEESVRRPVPRAKVVLLFVGAAAAAAAVAAAIVAALGNQ